MYFDTVIKVININLRTKNINNPYNHFKIFILPGSLAIQETNKKIEKK